MGKAGGEGARGSGGSEKRKKNKFGIFPVIFCVERERKKDSES